MSLLMDALKRAETSKQEAARTQAGADNTPFRGQDMSLEPLPTGRPKGRINPLPELASHLDAADTDLATPSLPQTHIPPHPRSAPSSTAAETPDAQAERDSVRNAFMAKLADQPTSRRPLWLALGTLAIAALAIAAYVWYQLNSMGGNTLAPPTSRAPAGATAPPLTAEPVAAVPINPSPVFTPSSQSTAANNTANTKTPLFSPPRPISRSARAPSPAQDESPGIPIRLTRTYPEPDKNLLQGHANIQHNELDLARQNYAQVLQRDPNNTDALLALAAIAQRQGRPGDAEQLNQKAYIANPGDPAVQAAMLSGVAAKTDPQATESRLKTLLANQPESAPLNFALGNLYARQARWPEAQQVYFNAVAADSGHPDYLFNLAVSLDQIRQSRPAAQHYRLALEAADKRPAAFDRAQVKRRLSELQPAAQPELQR